MNRRPSILAVRALNQYRRRDVVAYLGLRYYLQSSSTRSDVWARHLTTKLVNTRSSRPYFQAQHFKDITKETGIRHRPMFLPGPNEALAETALLDECSQRPEGFANPECVYSYHLARGDDRSGAFEQYSKGLRARHDAIAAACDETPGGIVRYLDIRRFYPSIDNGLAKSAWRRQEAATELPVAFRDMGEQLLSDFKAMALGDEKGILTGPMFSHLLANLVLRDFDLAMSAKMPGRYFRYVDDITLVGDSKTVASAELEVAARLKDLGFTLHGDESPKTLTVPVGTWLLGRDDYRENRREISWMTLIGGLKTFLLANPSARGEVQAAFASNGIRVPVHDYHAAARERGNLTRVLELAALGWFRRKTRAITVETLVRDAISLRERYQKELLAMLAPEPPKGFEKKRLIPMLRYRAGRLAYLSDQTELKELAASMRRYPELQFHAGVLTGIATRDLGPVLAMGTNAAQAAAQSLRAANATCTLAKEPQDDAMRQALAVVLLNGVTVERPRAMSGVSTFLRFASSGANPEMMRSADPFLRELACLHGLSAPRHAATLESVFDQDEHLAIDAVEQLQDSASL